MENTRKMILVDPEVLHHQQQHQSIQPDHLNDLNREMQDILTNETLEDREKWTIYQQVLEKFLHFTKNMRKPISIPIVDVTPGGANETPTTSSSQVNGMDDKEILDTVPVKLRRKTQVLLNRLRENPDVISWDKNSHVSVNGNIIPNSHITDLINDVIRERKKDPPVGCAQFAKALSQINIPNELIGNPKRRIDYKSPTRHQNMPESSSASGSTEVGTQLKQTPVSMVLEQAKKRKQPSRQNTLLEKWQNLSFS